MATESAGAVCHRLAYGGQFPPHGGVLAGHEEDHPADAESLPGGSVPLGADYCADRHGAALAGTCALPGTPPVGRPPGRATPLGGISQSLPSSVVICLESAGGRTQ